MIQLNKDKIKRATIRQNSYSKKEVHLKPCKVVSGNKMFDLINIFIIP